MTSAIPPGRPPLPLRRRIAAALLLVAGLAMQVAPAEARPAPARRLGAVSAADPRAAEAGAEMLRAGGSATDAALATMLALSVVEPQSSGIGGGGFFVRGDAKGKVTTIDGRESAPAAVTADWWLQDGKPMTFAQAQPGGRSVGVPGAIRLAAEAHARHGRLAWARLFRPAIRLARSGFVVTARLHASLARANAAGALDPEARRLFYRADGAPVAAGTRVRNPALAAFLGQVAVKGPKAFYAGPNAAALAAEVSRAPHNPAPLTTTDIAAYTALAREPLCGRYRQWRICGMGPPSSGQTTVFAILKQLERFDLAALGPRSPQAWHLVAESMRLAYADRERYIGDPGFVTVPAAGLMDPSYLAGRSALIAPDRTMPAVAAGTPPGAEGLARAAPPPDEEQGTSHFVAVDGAGEAVSFTNTIEAAFGSGLMVNGYYLNNELTDFAFVPTGAGGQPVANAAAPRKRPRSSMAPTLVYDGQGKLRIAIGAAGGATIPAQVAKALIGVLDWKLDARAAIALPVLFAPGDTVFVEAGSAHETMIPALRAFGHADVQVRAASFKANAVEMVDGRLIGAADPRSEGAAVAP